MDRIAGLQTELGFGEISLETVREAKALLQTALHDNPRNARVLQRSSSLLNGFGVSLYNLGRVEETLVTFEQTVPILEDLVKLEPQRLKNRQDLAGSLYNIAVIRNSLGKDDAAHRGRPHCSCNPPPDGR